MSDPDGELTESLSAIEGAKENFSEDEQNIIDAWIAKLSEPQDSDENTAIINEYARTLAKLTTMEKQLLPPFNDLPPEGSLPPLLGESKQRKVDFPTARLPCAKTRITKAKVPKGAIPKFKRVDTSDDGDLSMNEFEDYEEMAKVLARSKGQSFAEFVAAISRHTSDYGQQLRGAMKAETTSFREYVDHVLSQRIKDLTEVLDKEQNSELQGIKKDIDKWQVQLSHCKKRIKDIIPNFDMEAYKKDKNYLKKVFAVSENRMGVPEDDSFKTWKEESCHRVKWYSDTINKLMECNDQMRQEISEMKTKQLDYEAKEAAKLHDLTKCLRCIYADNQKLKMEKDRLSKENALLSSQLGDDDDDDDRCSH